MALETLGGWDIWHVGQMAFRSYGTCLTACGTNGVYQMASGTSGTWGQMAFRSKGVCLMACGTNGFYQMASGTDKLHLKIVWLGSQYTKGGDQEGVYPLWKK